MKMEVLKIKRHLRLKKPYLIVAWPGMGDVAFKAANYLVEHLKAEELASIEAEGFFYLTGSVLELERIAYGMSYKMPSLLGIQHRHSLKVVIEYLHHFIGQVFNQAPGLERFRHILRLRVSGKAYSRYAAHAVHA